MQDGVNLLLCTNLEGKASLTKTSNPQWIFLHLATQQCISSFHTLCHTWCWEKNTEEAIIRLNVAADYNQYTHLKTSDQHLLLWWLPFWAQSHDAAFIARSSHSSWTSDLKPWSQIRARMVAHTSLFTFISKWKNKRQQKETKSRKTKTAKHFKWKCDCTVLKTAVTILYTK